MYYFLICLHSKNGFSFTLDIAKNTGFFKLGSPLHETISIQTNTKGSIRLSKIKIKIHFYFHFSLVYPIQEAVVQKGLDCKRISHHRHRLQVLQQLRPQEEQEVVDLQRPQRPQRPRRQRISKEGRQISGLGAATRRM
jgi:hypothetical protein